MRILIKRIFVMIQENMVKNFLKTKYFQKGFILRKNCDSC